MTRARNPNRYITMALRHRYALAKGELIAADLFADQDRIEDDLAHLGAVDRMFDSNADVNAIKPKCWTIYNVSIIETTNVLYYFAAPMQAKAMDTLPFVRFLGDSQWRPRVRNGPIWPSAT